MAPRKRPLAVRFDEKVCPAASGCIEWIGSITTAGYGVLWVDGRDQMAHRISWEIHKGPIPEGLQIDHLCRNTKCVNPDHLEPVTPGENIRRSPNAPPAVNARKTHCRAGHELSGANLDTYALSKGRRSCRTCARARWMEYYRRRASKVAES